LVIFGNILHLHIKIEHIPHFEIYARVY
jgi:hypothetical protein